jgi:hypothetical protein
VSNFPDGWSTLGGGLAEYQKAKRRRVGPFYVSLYYRYALNSYGQKTVSPFGHSSDGSSVYREIRLGYFVIGICTPTPLSRKIGKYIPFFRDGFWAYRHTSNPGVPHD